MPGVQPFFARSSAIQITSGVLPAPPTVRLPTTITGIPGCLLPRTLTWYRIFLRRTAQPKTRLTGHSSQATAPRRVQGFTFLPFGLRPAGELGQGSEAVGLPV